MNIRSDLAIDITEELDENNDGFTIKKERFNEIISTTVHIKNKSGENSIGRMMGKYITIEMPNFSHKSELLDYRLEILNNKIKSLIPPYAKSFLVVGLGNENITPDALGPKTIENVFATRHMENLESKILKLPKFNPVSVISTGVLAQTGIESSEYICSVQKFVKAEAVIVIDAFATNSINRLGKSIQICNTGISPGSGVYNSRKEISQKKLGVPVISIGIPTVIDYVFLSTKESEENNKKATNNSMIVTPKNIDLIVDRASLLLGLGINCALNPQIEPDMFLSLM